MKLFNTSLRKMLLLTSVLFAPSLALAQTAPPAEEPVAEDGEIVVLGRNIPEPMRETSEIATFLSAEELERTGDDTAAEALVRLTGLSLVSDRFVFVRGLGDRYSSALLNGSPLPSPEPLRRTVPLDLFPSSILSGAAIQKTFSPNYPGEFGGGVIDLQTVSLPNAPFGEVKLSLGLNGETTLLDGLVYRGSDSDWSGYDDGLRDLPDALNAALAQGSFGNLTDSQIEAVGESLVNSPLSVIQTEEIVEPNLEIEASGGTSIQRGDVNIGFIGAAGFDRSWSSQRAERVEVRTDRRFRNIESFSTTMDVTANAFGGVSVGWDAHEIQATLLYVHSTSKEAQIDQGSDASVSSSTGVVFDESTAWYERELTTFQVGGEHEFGALQVDWRTAASRATRDAPYERSLRRFINEAGQVAYELPNNYNIGFSELTDDNLSGGVDLAYTLPLSSQREVILSGGYAYSNTERDYQQLRFRFDRGTNLPNDVQIARPDFLFSPDNIDPARFVLSDTTQRDDFYVAELEVNGGYVMADAEVLPLLRTSLGVRYEDATQLVETSDRFGNTLAGSGVELANTYWLPALTATWNFAEDWQLRAGYSQTIARPQFRELAPALFTDPETDRDYRGNPRLTDTELTNYDVRVERYLGRNQFVTLAGFYKDIERPIEETRFVSGDTIETTFVNVPGASLYGAEIEYRTRFDIPLENAFFQTRDWIFAVNYTYTKSEVEAAEGEFVFYPNFPEPVGAELLQIDGAQLQGTPENILNLQFGWESEDQQLTLLVGWVDTRIVQRGVVQDPTNPTFPDVVEDPGVNVDLVFRQDFQVGEQAFTFGLAGRNLLDEAHEEYQESPAFGRTNFNTYDRGVSLSASLSAQF